MFSEKKGIRADVQDGPEADLLVFWDPTVGLLPKNDRLYVENGLLWDIA